MNKLTNSLVVMLALALCLVPVVTAGLVPYYALYVFNSTGNNTTTVFDTANNILVSRNLTINGNPRIPSYNGYGVATENMTVSNSTQRNFGEAWEIGGQNNSWSAEGWFVPTNGATNWGTVWSTSFNAYDNRSSCQMNVNAVGVFACGLYNGSAYVADKSCLMSNNGIPHSFVYTWNRSTNVSQLYCDNIVSSTSAGGSMHTGAAQRSFIGQRTDNAEPFNGTVTWIGLQQRPLNSTEISEVQTLGYNYLNTTAATYGSYVNITIGSTPTRTLPSNFRGIDTHNQAGFPYTLGNSSVRNNTLDLAVLNSTNVKAVRITIDLPNLCTSYSGSPTNPCNFGTDNTSNFANINLHRSILGNASLAGRKFYVNLDGMPKWLADNSSKCTYGSTAGGYFNYTSCDASNNTILANAIIQYFKALKCDTTYSGTCYYEGRNEAYLSNVTTTGAGVGVFYYRNATVDCAARTLGTSVEWNNTFPLIKASLGGTVTYLSGAMNYGFSACGVAMSNSFMTQHPYGGNASPDFMNDHEYSPQNPPAMTTDYSTAESAFLAGGYNGSWRITETNLNNNALNTNSPEVSKAYLMSTLIYAVENTTLQFMNLYGYDNGDTYDYYTYPNQLNVVGIGKFPYLVHNASKYIDDTAGTVYPCNVAGSSGVFCAYVVKNSTQGVLLVSNRQNATLLIQSVTRAGSNLTGGVSNTNGTIYSGSGGFILNVPLSAYGIDGYNYTIQGNDTTPPVITLLTTWTNQSYLQINITCDEACNSSINRGRDNILLGNKTNNSAFTSVSYSYNFTPVFSNTNYYYNVTLCDVNGNCATYGLFSEATNAYNISFNGTNPVTTTPSIAEPNSLNFSFNITNPDNLNTTITWRINGTNQTSCYNTSTCNFTGSLVSSGTYLYNVTIVTDSLKPANNLSFQWLLTVNDTGNISYSSTTPTNTVTIAEPTSINLVVAISNPGGLSTTTEWLVNGTNQTLYYNTTTYSFTGGYNTSGLYNITNRVYAQGVLALNNTWLLTVTDTAPPSPAADRTTACNSAASSFASISGWMLALVTVLAGIFVVFAIKGVMQWEWMVMAVLGLLVLTFIMVFAIAILTGVSSLC